MQYQIIISIKADYLYELLLRFTLVGIRKICYLGTHSQLTRVEQFIRESKHSKYLAMSIIYPRTMSLPTDWNLVVFVRRPAKST